MRSSRMTAAAIAMICGLAIGALAIGPPATDAGAQGLNRPPSRAVETNVDVELVIAVDVSYSMDPDEQALQREGYITGLTSPEFLNALRQGMHGKIAITYFEWAGSADQQIVVPWRLVDGPASARAFADEVAHAPYRRAYRTSISGALRFAQPLFEGSGFRGLRRVIDVSGDGVNNQGVPVTMTRDEALERLSRPPYDEEDIAQEFEYVATKLGISVDELQSYMDAPNKSYRDYRSQEQVYWLGARVMRFFGLELGGKR